jgi:hypothetical protein
MVGLLSSVRIAHIACYWKFFLLHYMQVFCQYMLGTNWSVLRFSRYSLCMDPIENTVPLLMWVTWYHTSHCTELLTGNGCLCWLNYSGFQQICHYIYVYIHEISLDFKTYEYDSYVKHLIVSINAYKSDAPWYNLKLHHYWFIFPASPASLFVLIKASEGK